MDKIVKYTTKDEIRFLKEMMNKRDTVKRLTFLAGYTRGIRQRSKWGDINWRKLLRWHRILADAVVMDFSLVHNKEFYDRQIKFGFSKRLYTVNNLIRKLNAFNHRGKHLHDGAYAEDLTSSLQV